MTIIIYSGIAMGTAGFPQRVQPDRAPESWWKLKPARAFPSKRRLYRESRQERSQGNEGKCESHRGARSSVTHCVGRTSTNDPASVPNARIVQPDQNYDGGMALGAENSPLVRYRRPDRYDGVRRRQFDRAVRADMRGGDRDLGPVAYAQLAHNFADMNFHGRFSHTELATDHLVGVALAETDENGVLPFGKLGRVPRAVK